MRASSYEEWLKWREEYFKKNLKINYKQSFAVKRPNKKQYKIKP